MHHDQSFKSLIVVYPCEAPAFSAEADTAYASCRDSVNLEQGLEQGRRNGVRQGETHILLRLLQRKFGELPGAVIRRVEDADQDSLLAWSERVLTAETLSHVFD